ncbi:MAG: S1 RNA-binding domain-containing protein [Lachnospiraceae bacterium]|nr:S1 RNA-binding domain-containing protein [Lachnospiraceae bacterium]
MSSIFRLGEIQKLQVVKEVPMGVYLSLPETMRDSSEPRELILLPSKEVPKDTGIDDLIEVFIYKDSEDRPIATTKKPAVTLGNFAYLKVAQVNDIGAFLSWGLLKDLFMPFKEQTYRVQEGDTILVSLYLDKSERLCATMNLYPLLQTDSNYKVEDSVNGTIYDISDNFGAFVAVDDKYSALIPSNELFRKVYIGERVHARVKEVKPDGKLTLSIREKTQIQMDKDCAVIMEHLKEHGGFLPFHDKSSPESIKREFQMSKSEFKRAIGRLYKNKLIVIGGDGIRINRQP